jgi:hypothetical protein
LIRSEQHISCTHIEKAPINARHGIIKRFHDPRNSAQTP